MIKHIVAWRLKDSAHGLDKAATAQAIKQKLEGLRGRIPGLQKLEVGIDFSATDASSDVVLCTTFPDRAALDAYQVHPEHQAVAAYIRAAASERRLIDYEVPDPRQ